MQKISIELKEERKDFEWGHEALNKIYVLNLVNEKTLCLYIRISCFPVQSVCAGKSKDPDSFKENTAGFIRYSQFLC